MAGLHHQKTGWHFSHFLPFPCGGIPPGPKWRPHPNTAFIPRWMVIGGVRAVTTVTLPFVCVCVTHLSIATSQKRHTNVLFDTLETRLGVIPRQTYYVQGLRMKNGLTTSTVKFISVEFPCYQK